MSVLFELYITFFKIGIVTFGGGLTMLPLLERVLVDQKKWTTMDELLDYYAISQTTPGIIAVNVSTFVGHKRRGILGGIASTLGMVSPSVIIITLIALFISNFEDIIFVQKAMKGINAAVCALLTYSVFTLCKKNIKSFLSAVIFIAAFSAMYFFNIHTVLITLTAGLIGGILSAVKNMKKAQGDNDK